MSIEIGSKWVKDGEVVEVLDTLSCEHEQKNDLRYCDIVFYQDKELNNHVLTERDFLEQYKPYEPVYEYQWAYKRSTDSRWSISDIFYLDTPYLTRDAAEYQRLDFTKRERKC